MAEMQKRIELELEEEEEEEGGEEDFSDTQDFAAYQASKGGRRETERLVFVPRQMMRPHQEAKVGRGGVIKEILA